MARMEEGRRSGEDGGRPTTRGAQKRIDIEEREHTRARERERERKKRRARERSETAGARNRGIGRGCVWAGAEAKALSEGRRGASRRDSRDGLRDKSMHA